MNLSPRHWLEARKPATRIRRKRACPVGVARLEGRLLLAGDITPPVTTVHVVPDTLNSTGYYTVSPETVLLTASDPDSPIGLRTFYNVDHTGFVQGNALQLFNGIHTLQFYSVDPSGNREATRTDIIKIDSTAPVVSASAKPSTLWPPNGKFVPVTVSGHVFDASGGVPGRVTYRVIDEYGQVQPSGAAHVVATNGQNGHYSFVVSLQSSRLGQDKDGRHYAIIVTATDEADNSGSAVAYVVVPHDQGHQAVTISQPQGKSGGKKATAPLPSGTSSGDSGANHGHNNGNHGQGNGNQKDNGQGNGNQKDNGQGNGNQKNNGGGHGHGHG